MAQPTTEHPVAPPHQAATPGVGGTGAAPAKRPAGVGMMGAPPVVEPLEPAKPVLWEDIDPVLLIRLYPEAESADALRALAMAAVDMAYEQGLTLMASQQEPVQLFDEAGVPIPRERDQRAGTTDAEKRRIEAERRAANHPATPEPHQPQHK